VLDAVGGSPRGDCVEVGEARDVRSGGLAAGPFDEARAGFRDTAGDARTVRLYVIPQHTRATPGIVVRGQRDDGALTFRAVEANVSHADRFEFYDLDITVPSAGRWRLRASAGADSGCWTVVLG
jgi:hypothetical protein